MASAELSHSKNLTESVESMDGKTPFGQLLGFGHDMAKLLGIEGILTSTDNYQIKLDQYISGFRDNIDSESYHSTDVDNMVKVLMLKWVLTQNPEIEHWYSKNRFTEDDGTIIYSGLWNGYRIVKYKDLTDGIILELGTESITFYKGINGKWNPIEFKIKDKDYDKFWEIVSEDFWDKISPLDFIKSIMVDQGIINNMSDSVIVFGTQKAREMCDFDKWYKYGIDVISQEDECRYEYLSVVNAHEKVPQAGLQMYELCATVGYGDSFYQGYNTLSHNQTLIHDIGVIRLIEIMANGFNSKSVKFSNTDEFDETIEDVKDELYKYEEGFMSKLKKQFFNMFNT